MRIKFLYILFLISNLIHAQGIPDDKNDYLISLSTGLGEIKLILFDETPIHKMNFAMLARAGVYDHITFHRVIDDFMIQTGDPHTSNRSKSYDPSIIEETIPAEIRPQFQHVYGAVGAARRGFNNPAMESNGSQFYIVENPNGAHHLDNKYTVFGQVVDGFDVIHKIAEIPTNERDRPLDAVRMTVEVEEMERLGIESLFDFNYP